MSGRVGENLCWSGIAKRSETREADRDQSETACRICTIIRIAENGALRRRARSKPANLPKRRSVNYKLDLGHDKLI